MTKVFVIFLFIGLAFQNCLAYSYEPNGSSTDRKIFISGTRIKHPHLSEPIVFFHSQTSIISIDFGDQPIEDYTVTISSPFTDVDYYVTSSYTTIPLVVDGYSDYNIIIETSDGDIFEGTLAASEYASTQMF